MKAVTSALVLTGLCAGVAFPQGRPIDWPSYGGDARRSGYARNDLRITKENAGKLELIFKRKVDNSGGPEALTPPVVIGLLISYKGFKELGFVQSSSGTLLALDVDLNKPFWQKKFDAVSGGCSGVTAIPALTPPMLFVRRPAGAGTAGAPGARPPGSGSQQGAQLPARLGGGGFGGSRPVWVLAADGQLRQINSADGSDQYPALKFVPPGSDATVMTMNDNVIYTATRSGCGSSKDGVWALNMREENPVPVSHAFSDGAPTGTAGYAVGTNGTVYAQSAGGTLVALSGHELKSEGELKVGAGSNATPVVFEHMGRDLVVAAGGDGKLHVVDSKGFTEISASPLTGKAWGGLSTWEDADGARWVGATVWGDKGGLVAYKLADEGGKPTLKQQWVSRDLDSPLPPVATAGTVFVLSTGSKGKGKAVLYGFDAATGKEVYNSGSQITGTGTLTGLSLANGRIYFTTTDSTLWCFGIGIEI